MAKTLFLIGTISVGIKGKSKKIGAGTDVTEISWPDKKYGLKESDLQRMLDNGTASFEGGSASGNLAMLTNVNIDVDAERMAEFSAKIAMLDSNNDDHFTNDGAPDVNALKEIGLDTSAEERDAVWAILKNFIR